MKRTHLCKQSEDGLISERLRGLSTLLVDRLVTLGQVTSLRPYPVSSVAPTKHIIRTDYDLKGVRTLEGGSRTMVDNGPGNRHCKQHKFT